MAYIVKALDKITGEPKTLWYDVDTEEDAIKMAYNAGCVVESVEKASGSSKPKASNSPKIEAPPPEREINDEQSMLNGAESLGVFFFSVTGGLMLLIGIVTGIGPDYRVRFQTDNAYGAAANALEVLEGRVMTSAVLISALLCLVIASLIMLRGAVRKAGRDIVAAVKGAK